ncbi:amino acid deaminase [Microbacterium sp. ARD32]|uniref:amino acid deaminase n=1 Tax=Microbacterium sp. ARD32 TaxID=2962577 RepID=UPI0028812355|nr:amino acid deaminase [Microbacterium sp. ARD32]MDT0158703.1 amino acid deaminase [Microbacterium sp. ARD32]
MRPEPHPPAQVSGVPAFDEVAEFVSADAAHGRFDDWGRSTVIDENTGAAVIDEDLFARLHAIAGIPARFPVGSAGLIHVYGYWFSTVLTPYGYKRDRWQDGGLATTLGQPPHAFRLWGDEHSTPLQRVTAVALPLLAEPPVSVRGRADAAVDGVPTRVVLAGPEHDRAPGSAARSGATALIYGARTAGAWRLITVFPMSGDPEAVVADYRADVRWRWNAAPPQAPSPAVHPK